MTKSGFHLPTCHACQRRALCAGNLTVTCPAAGGMQPRNSSLAFVLQAWSAARPQHPMAVDLRVARSLPGTFHLSYHISKVGAVLAPETHSSAQQ